MLTILWDNDGVLVDTEGLYFRATQTALAEVGIELTPEQFKEISLKRGESTFLLAAEQGISRDEITRLRAKRDRIYTEFLRTEPCLIDGAEEVLRALHGQVRMGVVTSTHRQPFDIAHARTGLTKYLEFVIAHGDYQHSKPHPEPYLTALARHQLRPKKCIVVEDSERGLPIDDGQHSALLAVEGNRAEFKGPGRLGRFRSRSLLTHTGTSQQQDSN